MKDKKKLFNYLPVIVVMGIVILVATIFAKNATVQKSMSLTEITVECTSNNYDNRDQDAVCGDGYKNVGNTCDKKPTYTYDTCNDGTQPQNGECSYEATISYYCKKQPACLCYLATGVEGQSTVFSHETINCENANQECSDVCLANNYTGPGTNPADNDESCCPNGYQKSEEKCIKLLEQVEVDCPNGEKKVSTYSCPNGGNIDDNNNCIYEANKTQTGTKYTGNITCEKIDDTYTVKYDKNNSNATGTTNDSIHTIDVEKSLTANGYKLSGHIFRGWNSQSNGNGTNYNDQQSVINLTTAGSTITIYAKWETCPAGQYAEAGATSCSPCTDNTYTDTTGQSSCLACPEGQTVNSTHTGCVNYEEGTYTVKYDKNNTSATGATADSIHTIGVSKALTQNGYKLGGHIFNGWNTISNGTGTSYTDKESVINLSTTNGATVNLYAQWTPCPAGQYAEAGATSCSPCTDNTYTDTTGQSSCSTCPEGQIANSTHTSCVVGTYTVKYNKSDENATGTTADSIHTIGVSKALTQNGYKLGGHIFNGWNTIPNGTGTSYTDKQSVINLSMTNGTIVNLYAQWTPCPAGQYAEAGATSCSPCTDNTYTDTTGQSSCLACPEGRKVNSNHTGCDDVPLISCKAGTYLKANGTTEEDCLVCVEGYYCPGGEYTPGEEDQGKEPCPAGHVNGGVGLSTKETCKIKCQKGYYKDEVAASECIKCPDDTTSNSHYVNFENISPEGTCFSTTYNCYVCDEKGEKTYTWTNKKINKNNCIIDTTKDASSKCKAKIKNPGTGLFEVGSALISMAALAGFAYFALRKKMISNI